MKKVVITALALLLSAAHANAKASDLRSFGIDVPSNNCPALNSVEAEIAYLSQLNLEHIDFKWKAVDQGQLEEVRKLDRVIDSTTAVVHELEQEKNAIKSHCYGQSV